MIRTIRLHNFKCFSDQSIELGGLTLLTGLNGMGKSSVLQSLLLLRQSYQQNLLPRVGLALDGELVQLGTAQSIFYEDATDDRIGIEVQWDDGQDASFWLDYDRTANVMNLASIPVVEDLFSSSLFVDTFHYLRAERIGPRTSFGMSDNAVRHHRQLGTSGEWAVHFLDQFRDDKIASQLWHPGAASDSLFSQVEAWLGEVSPGARLHIQPYSDLDVVNLTYSFATGQQISKNFRATAVGFGLTYTLPILVAILSSVSGSLILLENPEAHLHPHGQVQIGHLLACAASAGIQIVVESHSDHILNGIRLAVHDGIVAPDSVRIHYFSREERDGHVRSQSISPHLDSDGRISEWPDGFFDEWEKNLEALLEPAVKP